jgi:threonine/homoserine/homoserine lactone efflux protein
MHLFSAGFFLGVSCAIVPGPILTLIVLETLRRGLRGGLRVFAAFLLSEIFAVTVSFLILSRLSHGSGVTTVISILGAATLFYLGIQTLRNPGTLSSRPDEGGYRFRAGLATGITNPNPYLFWLTAGGGYFVLGQKAGGMQGYVFLAAFVGSMALVKLSVIFAVHRSRHFLSPRHYRWINFVLGCAMFGFAAMLLIKGTGNPA